MGFTYRWACTREHALDGVLDLVYHRELRDFLMLFPFSARSVGLLRSWILLSPYRNEFDLRIAFQWTLEISEPLLLHVCATFWAFVGSLPGLYVLGPRDSVPNVMFSFPENRVIHWWNLTLSCQAALTASPQPFDWPPHLKLLTYYSYLRYGPNLGKTAINSIIYYSRIQSIR
jgi:hypothetical protein